MTDLEAPPSLPPGHHLAHTDQCQAASLQTSSDASATTMPQGDLDITWQHVQATFAGSERFRAYANLGITMPTTRTRPAGPTGGGSHPKRRRPCCHPGGREAQASRG